jgi:superfamily II DNA or RNA helicase
MNLIIKNDIEIENPTFSVLRWCEENLVVDNPDYIIANRLGRYVGKMEKSLHLYVRNGNKLLVPYGCLSSIWSLSKGASFQCLFPNFKGNSMSGHISLYDYQERALKSLKKGKNGVLEAPCGSGKTQIGLQFIREIGGKALWLTHTKKLLQQSKERAEAYFEGDFGTITDGKVNIGKDITFATVQTMRMLDPSVYANEFDIVVVDECHHCVGTPTKVMQFYQVLTNLNCRYKLGLSATLTRSDKMTKCIFFIIGKKLHTITEQEVGSKIIKAKHIKVPLYEDYPLEDYCQPDGMIDYGRLVTMLSDDEKRNGIICSNILNYCSQNKKQIVLCSRLSQIDHLKNLLSSYGLKVCVITGKVRQKDRDYKGDVILATYAIAKEGLDIPELDVVHFAIPQKDKSIVKQSAGRVERNFEGKAQPLVIDYVDMNIDYCLRAYEIRKRILK